MFTDIPRWHRYSGGDGMSRLEYPVAFGLSLRPAVHWLLSRKAG